MPNLTLHRLWHTFMPVYQHVIGVCTHALSALAFYLMLTKTPKAGRPFARYLMMLQASVTLVDLNFGFLTCPIVLYPLPGALCNGVICTVFGTSGHIGFMLMNIFVSYVAISLLYCYHFKFVTILRMTKHRNIPEKYNVIFRVAVFLIYTILSIIQFKSHRNIESGPEYTRLNYPSLYYLFENANFRMLVYDPSVFVDFTIYYISTVILVMILSVATFAFFGFGSLYLLSLQASLAQSRKMRGKEFQNPSISDRTRKLQEKAMITLIVQTVVVGIIQVVPLAVYGYSVITVSLTPDITNLWFCFQLTHAIVHTIVLILTTPIYRDALVWLVFSIDN